MNSARSASAAERPIFFDPSGRRRRFANWSVFLAFAVVLVLSCVFGATLLTGSSPAALLPRDMRHTLHALASKATDSPASSAAWGPFSHHEGRVPVAAAFYVPWDPASRLSLQLHVNDLDWVMPTTLSIAPDARLRKIVDRPFEDAIGAAKERPIVLPVVQNAAGDIWYGREAAGALARPEWRRSFVRQLSVEIAASRGGGVIFDLEELPANALASYCRLLQETRAAFAPKGWMVGVAAPAGMSEGDLRALAASADRVLLMTYDEHAVPREPGPIASQMWFGESLARALRAVPAEKLIAGIGSYAYDWHGGRVDDLSNEEAWLAAHDSNATIDFDTYSGNATLAYEDGGEAHRIWMLDAASAWNELKVARAAGLGGVAVWRLGSEDPGLWPVLRARQQAIPPFDALKSVAPVTDVDVEGTGELLRIEANPQTGQRVLRSDSAGFIIDEQWQTFPTPFVVRRGGYRPGFVALTFDDGPDERWTPKILDTLEAERVPATFFIVGENAVGQRSLLRRMDADGDEIGNHSYTHPNMAQLGAPEIRLELAATRRLIEAYTGRSTRLFRAPYFGDAEPTTGDELWPALTAQQAGYLNVGLHVDANDWQRPGAQAIVDSVVKQVTSGTRDNPMQVVLLHDSGGDRSETAAALPAIIRALKQRGYRFTTISGLAGVNRDAVMPPVPPSQAAWVSADFAFFSLTAIGVSVLAKLFALAIILGLARAMVMTGLALASKRRAKIPPPLPEGMFVSVLIAAFNEARVIEDSVRGVLRSEQVDLEVIVIDDGSTDGTSEIVERAFARDERVRLVRVANGGKARALNHGLQLARGEIVIALDADTQFEPQTVARLARWFADASVGAVSGNAKVGNRINLVTRWQAVEYVTAQNLERRALGQFGAITVVPGAVGAWRRSAILSAGGYPTETLAEDQDLTIAIQRVGWRVAYDMEAVAWTEAPQSFRSLAKQRFRWAYGTLQCLWKHRAILRSGRPRGLALCGLPQAWLFQIGFALISPIIDLALVLSFFLAALQIYEHGWAQTETNVFSMATYWLVFMTVDALCGWIAFKLDRTERRFPLFLLLAQRVVYRQIMYSVALRAVWTAVGGPLVGWGKLERTGAVAIS